MYDPIKAALHERWSEIREEIDDGCFSEDLELDVSGWQNQEEIAREIFRAMPICCGGDYEFFEFRGSKFLLVYSYGC